MPLAKSSRFLGPKSKRNLFHVAPSSWEEFSGYFQNFLNYGCDSVFQSVPGGISISSRRYMVSKYNNQGSRQGVRGVWDPQLSSFWTLNWNIPGGSRDNVLHAQWFNELIHSAANTIELKGLAHAKIIKKSVILFWLLNITIWCKHVHRLELQKF